MTNAIFQNGLVTRCTCSDRQLEQVGCECGFERDAGLEAAAELETPDEVAQHMIATLGLWAAKDRLATFLGNIHPMATQADIAFARDVAALLRLETTSDEA
jgi:hypothetical protein